MTRKNYIKFAAIIRSHECPNGSSLDTLGGWNYSRNELRDKIADIFAADNPRIDRAKLSKASGNY